MTIGTSSSVNTKRPDPVGHSADGHKPPNGKKGRSRSAGWNWLGLGLAGVAVVGVSVVLARKDIAEMAAESWLKGQGVAAHITIDKLSLKHAEGRVVIGDPKKPDMSLEHFSVDYQLNLMGGGLPLARIDKLKLTHPVAAFSIKGGKFYFGSLDKLVQSALSAPPSNAAPPAEILIENADLQLDTDYGLIKGQGAITLRNGLLTLLDMRTPAMHLKGTLGAGDLREGRITARSVTSKDHGDQLHVETHMMGDNWTVKGGGNLVETIGAEHQKFFAQNIVFGLDAYLPYRPSKSMYEAFSGDVAADFTLHADVVDAEATQVKGFETGLHLDGALKTNTQGSAYSGTAKLTTQADSLTSGDMKAHNVTLSGDQLTLNTGFSSQTGLAFNLSGPLDGEAARFDQGDLSVQAAHLKLHQLAMTSGADGAQLSFNGGMTIGQLKTGDVSLSQTVVSLNGSGQAKADAGPWQLSIKSDISSQQAHYAGLGLMARDRVAARLEAAKKTPAVGAPNPPAPDAIITLNQALETFSLRIHGLDLSLNSNGGKAGIDISARLKTAEAILKDGGKVVVTPIVGRPVLNSAGKGAFGLALSGPDLPTVALDVDGLGVKAGGVSGGYKLAAQFNFDPLDTATFDGQGRFTMIGGGLTATLSAPAHFTAKSAELGEHVEVLTATLNQTGKTFLNYTPKGWHATGSYSELNLKAPNELVGLTYGKGDFEAYSLADGVGFKAELSSATLSDGVPAGETRFNPLTLNGTIEQDTKALTGRFFVATPSAKQADGAPLRIAAVNLDHNLATAVGALSFKTLDINFKTDGLQPVYLSPLVAAVFSKDVKGPISFDGAFNWNPSRTWSGGHLTIDGLDFVGATGASQGLKSDIIFNSLAPLTSEPGQTITLAQSNIGVPLTDMNLSLQFLDDHVAIEKANVQTPGGPLTLEPTEVYFDGKTPISGVVTFAALDFGKVIAATDLATSMTFKGQLSGRIPFKLDQGHISIDQGAMDSDSPGQIQIKRTAVSGVDATGTVTSNDTNAATQAADKNAQAAAAAVEFNPFQDLAFQAMEYVTYDKIDARLNSKDGGILNVNFHIKGYFDPPKPQKAKISIVDYLSGKWMTKPITLPSKTPVELYLEIPINLDEILNDLTAFNVRTAQKPKQ